MIQYPRTIRNFNAFVDGVSYAGIVTEAKIPELKTQNANHRGGGMDAPIAIDMGLEAMQAELTFAEWLPALPKMFGTRQRFVLRPAALGEDDFTATSNVITLGGRFSVVNFADLKPSSDVPMKMTSEIDYFRFAQDGVDLFEIDVRAGKRIIGGVDQLASIRGAMGF